jgi:hypothetical protein
MKKTLFFLVLFVANIAFSNEATLPLCQTFYKNQEYSQLVKTLKENSFFSDTLEKQKRDVLLIIETVFMAQALKEHPEFLPLLARDFSMMTLHEKAVFLRGVRLAKMDLDLLKNISDKELNQMVYDDANLPNLNNLAVKQPLDLDLLWTSFFATGKEGYIRRIVEVLNSDDTLLLLAYHWDSRCKMIEKCKNRKQPLLFDDLEKRLQEYQKKRKEAQVQFSIILAAYWSLEVNAKQDRTIEEILKKITKNEPSLDYWQKINKSLGK